MDISKKIKNLRMKMGLTQEELAERCDLTKGFISQIEHGNTSPSVDNLDNIVNALGTNMSEFFKEEKEEKVVYKKEDAFFKEYKDKGLKIEWIVSDCQKNMMEPTIMEINKGCKTKTYKPFEGESFGFILDGKVKLYLDNRDYIVEKNDSFYFEANKKYYIENIGKIKAKILWVLTPPNF